MIMSQPTNANLALRIQASQFCSKKTLPV